MTKYLDGFTAIACIAMALAIGFFGYQPQPDFVAFVAFLALARVCGDPLFTK